MTLTSTRKWLLADNSGSPVDRGARRRAAWLRHTLFAVAYTIAVIMALSVVYSGTSIAIIWPSAGIAVWWASTCRTWRGFVLMSAIVVIVPAAYWLFVQDATPLAVLLIGVSNFMIGPAIGIALAVQERITPTQHDSHGEALPFKPNSGLRVARHVYRLLITAIVAVALAKGIVLLAFAESGVAVSFSLYTTLVLRDLASIIAIAGPGMAISTALVRHIDRKAIREFLAALALTILVLSLVFGFGQDLPVVYLVMLPLYWSATRLPVTLASIHAVFTTLATVGLALIIGTVPFAISHDNIDALATAMQLFVILCMLLSLVVSTTVQQHSGLVQELDVLTKTIPDALLIVNRYGKSFAVNDDALDLVVESDTGGSLVKRPLLDLDGEPLNDGNRPSTRALRGETVEGMLVQLETGSDEAARRIYTVSAAPMYLAGEEAPGHALVLCRDSTNEYRAVRELQESYDEAQLLFDNAPQGIARLDAAGVIATANRAFGQLLGIHHGRLTGRTLEEFSSEPGVVCPDLIRPGSLVHVDRTFKTAHGELKHVALSFRSLKREGDALGAMLVNAVDVTERQKLHDLVAHLADHDPLTGLANRRRLEAEIARILESSDQVANDGALMMIDLDNFKQVNDELGHAAGDELLVEFSKVLTDSVRDDDVVGRLGGDEFVVVLPKTSRAGAESISQRITDAVSTHVDGRQDALGRVSASIGFTMFSEAREQGVDPLLLADRFLYAAKNERRRLAAARGAAATVSAHEKPWATGDCLTEILESDALRIELQPILDVSSGTIELAEGLLRVEYRGKKLPTGEFVAAVEDAELAEVLDTKVLGMGLIALQTLHRHRPEFKLALNVSARSLCSDSARSSFLATLERQQFPAGSLILEVTETAELTNLDVARQFQSAIGALGVSFAIDDFGVGHNPFRNIRDLEFQYLKIPGEFVERMTDSGVDYGIVDSISRLSQSQGYLTIAEYVSSAQILESVRRSSITYAQGHHIGAAVPLADFIETYMDSRES